MTALRTLLIDDEPLARARLRGLCADLEGIEIVGEAADGTEAMEQITAASPDIVLLDIAMPELDGLEVGRLIAGREQPPAVIFCTAYANHALAAFEIEAVDYLLKPISRERLARSITRAAQWRARISPSSSPSWLDHVWVPRMGGIMRIDLGEVDLIEAEGDYCRFTVGAESYLLHESLSRLEERLDPGCFVRIRRSVIVRLTEIIEITQAGSGAWQARLRSGRVVRIGGTYWKSLKHIIR